MVNIFTKSYFVFLLGWFAIINSAWAIEDNPKYSPVVFNDPLTSSIIAQTNILCFGNKTGSVTVSGSGGTGNYSYNITGNSFKSSGTFTDLAAGSYTITVRDGSGNTTTQPVIISQPPAISTSITSQTNNICFGQSTGSVTVTGSGGTGILTYSINGTTYQGSGTFNNLAAGTYNIRVKDENGCIADRVVTITQPSVISTSISQTNILCLGQATGGSISVNSSGGTGTRTISIDGVNFQSTSTFTNLASGTYTITVKDANDCIVTRSVTITQPASAVSASITSQTNILCSGQSTGSVTVAGSGGSGTLTYSKGNNVFQTSNVLTGLAAGTHTITVKDANGCIATQQVTITQPPAISSTITAQSNVTLCFGDATGSVTVAGSGGVGQLTYSRDGTNFQVSGTFNNLTAGSYTIRVKDENGCIRNQSVTISQPSALALSLSKVDVQCAGASTGSIRATGSGGTPTYTYSLNGGAYQSSRDFLNLPSGNYTVTVRDANGCSRNTAITIIEKDTQKPLITCPSDQIIYTSTGSTSAMINYTLPTANDNCDGNLPISVRGPVSGTTMNIGVHTVEFKAVDAAGNEAYCSTTFTIKGDFCTPDYVDGPNTFRTVKNPGGNKAWYETNNWINNNKPPYTLVTSYQGISTGPGGGLVIPAGHTVIMDANSFSFESSSGVFPNLIIYGTLVLNGQLVMGFEKIVEVMEGGLLTSCENVNSNKLAFRNSNNTSIGSYSPWRGDFDPILSYTKIHATWVPPGSDPYHWNEAKLPVSMLYFNGNLQGQKILLTWATASEKNFDFFTIERSSDAESFSAIGKVEGNGNSNIIQKYNFTDHSALKGKSYYRLKATDFDGTVEYHKIIMLEYKSVSSSFSIFPNPLEGQTFTLKSDLKIDEQSIIRIYNTVGVEVLHKKLVAGDVQFTFEISLEAGVYLVIVQNSTEKIQSKLMVR